MIRIMYCICVLFVLGQSSFAQTNRIIQAEYFWDTDQGEGSGTAILALDGNLDEAIETLFKSGITLPSAGIHNFSLRVKDTTGNWGPVFKTVVSVENIVAARSINVQQAEYFWDTDPGQGAGTVILALDGNLDEAIETLFKSGISLPSAGIHNFSLRVKDISGNWGAVFKTAVSVENNIAARNVNVQQAEYFWDTDPGEGSGTVILALDGNLDEAIETLFKSGITLPSAGMHNFSLRVKDIASNWGPVFKTAVSVENVIAARNTNVQQAEYFWDTDPGKGSGTVILALDGNLDEAIETLFKSGITLPSAGIHNFSLRVKDTTGNWGPVFKTIVSVENIIAARGIKVLQAEYFWDADPGQGSGTVILALDGNLDEAIETLFNNISVNISSGFHNFNIRVKDADSKWGPLFTTAIYVKNCNAPSLTSGITDASCSGVCNGNVNITTSGGTAPYTYKWSDGITTEDRTALCAGTYALTIADSANCKLTNTFNVSNASSIVLTTGKVDATCGNADGSASVTAAGGTLPYTYTWSNGGTASSILNLFSGSYTVTFTDVNGCKSTTTATVNNFGAPAVGIQSYTNVSCFGKNDGSATVTASGGALPYTFGWTNGAITATAGNLIAGTYTATVKDANECMIIITSIIISEPAVLTESIASTNVTCFGLCNGSADLTPGGGTVAYTYNWSNGITTQDQLGALCAGTYTATLKDAKGCMIVKSVVISEPPPVIIDIGPDTSVCSATGFNLDAGAGYISYNWSTGQSVQIITVNTSALYSVVVTDTQGCADSDTISITFTSNLIVDIGNDTTICSGKLITLDPGAGYISYLWSEGSTTQTINVSAAGTYWVQVSDGSCTGQDTMQVVLYPLTVANAGNDASICADDSVSLNATGGISYSWLPSAGLSCSNCKNPAASPAATTTYSVTATDTNGCQNSDNVIITVHILPIANAGNDTSVCEGGKVQLNATGGISYNWTPVSALSCTTCSNPSASPITTTTYTVSVSDTNGCKDTDDVIVSVGVLPTANYTYSTSGLTVTFTNMSTNASSYKWNFGDGNSSTSAATTVMHTYSSTGSFNVCLTATSGCGVKDYCELINVQETGIFNISDTPLIQIYPNPSDEVINITYEYNKDITLTIQLVNLLGEKMYVAQKVFKENHLETINISDLADGVYIIQLKSDDFIVVKAIVVN